jgi:hypothetical protein
MMTDKDEREGTMAQNDTAASSAVPENTHGSASFLSFSAERLSQVRYVFVVQIEDGIPSVDQRAALEYSDAVLMGWPQITDSDIKNPSESESEELQRLVPNVEKVVDLFRKAEKGDNTDDMADALVRITGYIASIRKIFQPGFLLPTYAEIHRVIEDEWNEEMSQLGAPQEDEEGRVDLHVEHENGGGKND